MRFKELLEWDEPKGLTKQNKAQAIETVVLSIERQLNNALSKGEFTIWNSSVRDRAIERVVYDMDIHGMSWGDHEMLWSDALKVAKKRGIADMEDSRVFPLMNHPYLKEIISGNQTLINEIKTTCGIALKTYKATKKVLYRGMTPCGLIAKKKTRDNRRPLDTPNSVHELLDKTMMELGCKAVRSNSAFCSTSRSTADSYGAVYVLFPKDGFDFTYFKNTSDFFEFMNSQLEQNDLKRIETKDSRNSVSRKSLNYLLKNLKEIVIQAGPEWKNFRDALATENEVMVANTEYIAVQFQFYQYILRNILK